MVTDRTLLNYISQIALLFAPNDAIARAGITSRLKNNFDNENFMQVIESLQSHRWQYAEFIRAIPISGGFKVYFRFTDILLGNHLEAEANIPNHIFNAASVDWKKVIEYINEGRLKYSHIVGNKIIFNTTEHGGYGIAFVPQQPVTTGGGTTTGGTIPTGYVSTYQPAQPAGAQTPVGIDPGAFDFESLLIPAGIAIAAYFLLIKK